MELDIREAAIRLIQELEEEAIRRKGMADGVRLLYAEVRRQAEASHSNISERVQEEETTSSP